MLTRTRYKIILYITGSLTLGYLCALVCFALDSMPRTGSSRAFLEQVASIPPRAAEILLAVGLTVLALILLESWMNLRFKEDVAESRLYVCIAAEFLLGIVMNYYLLCSISSVFLLVIGNIILFPIRNRGKMICIVLTTLFYIAVEVNQITHFWLPCGFEQIISFLGDSMAGVQSVVVLLKTVDIAAFIILCLASINTTAQEKQQIETLNSALKHTIDELNVSNVQLKQQAKRDEELAVYKERLRLSQDMHDIVGHVLTGIVVGLKACEAMSEDDDSPLVRQMRRLSHLASHGLNDLRQAINDTRVSAKESYSLFDQIDELLESISQCVNIAIETEIKGDTQIPLNSVQENVIYRVAQESVTNAIRHAHAKNIWFRMELGSVVSICVENDGAVEADIREGVGLSSMRERVRGLNGGVAIHLNAPDRFTLKVWIPVEEKKYDENPDC